MPGALESTTMIDAVARCRYAILTRAHALLNDTDVTHDQPPAETVRGLSGLLMTSLEELKVAEQELRAQQATLVAQREGIDARTHHYRELFLHTPAPALVTDTMGTIHEANIAAGRLFRRPSDELERTAIPSLLPRDDRDEFRRQLSRFSARDGVRDWRLTIHRVGDLPLIAHATVQFVPDLGPSSSGVLYWLFSTNSGTA
ncbi:MAG TPA: PAS domain-containing protein [Gemmatimonadaceae bacterium]|jgi:PAS domain S-box-containing protein